MGREAGELTQCSPRRRKPLNAGFSGVIKYPTIIRFDGKIRQDLESVGLEFARESEMIAMGRECNLHCEVTASPKHTACRRSRVPVTAITVKGSESRETRE